MAVDVSSGLQLSDQLTEWFWSSGVHRQSNDSLFSLYHRPRSRPRPRSGSWLQSMVVLPNALPLNLVAADVRRLHWNLELGSSLDLGAWDLDLSPAVHTEPQCFRNARGNHEPARRGLLPLRCLSRLARGWQDQLGRRRGQG